MTLQESIKHAVAEGYWPKPVKGSIQAPFIQSQDGAGGMTLQESIKHAVAEGYWPRPVFGSIQAPFIQSQDGNGTVQGNVPPNVDVYVNIPLFIATQSLE